MTVMTEGHGRRRNYALMVVAAVVAVIAIALAGAGAMWAIENVRWLAERSSQIEQEFAAYRRSAEGQIEASATELAQIRTALNEATAEAAAERTASEAANLAQIQNLNALIGSFRALEERYSLSAQFVEKRLADLEAMRGTFATTDQLRALEERYSTSAVAVEDRLTDLEHARAAYDDRVASLDEASVSLDTRVRENAADIVALERQFGDARLATQRQLDSQTAMLRDIHQELSELTRRIDMFPPSRVESGGIDFSEQSASDHEFLGTRSLARSLETPLTPDLGSAPPKTGENYVICYDIEDRSKGHVNLTFGGVPIMGHGASSVTYDVWVSNCGSVTALSSDPVRVVKSDDFDGRIAVTVHALKKFLNPSATIEAQRGTGEMEIRVTGSGRTQSYYLGRNAGKSAAADMMNIGIGNGALENVITGDQNIGIGWRALSSVTGGRTNIGIGSKALQLNTTGYNNTAVGTASQEFNTTGFDNVSIGIRSLALNETGDNNTGLGTDAFEENVSGNQNTGMGAYAGRLNRVSSNNTAGGFSALYNYADELGQNTALGVNALWGLKFGGNNVGIGMNAGVDAERAVNSVWLGLAAGDDEKQARSVTNSTAIGANSWTDKDNQISLGDEAVREIRTWGTLTFEKGYPVDGKDVEPGSLFKGADGRLYFKPDQGAPLPISPPLYRRLSEERQTSSVH